MLVALGEASINTLDDLGDLASDELMEIISGGALTQDSANAIIMAARAHWFDDEDGAPDADAAEVAETEAEVETVTEKTDE